MDWAVKMTEKVCKVFSSPRQQNNFLQCVEDAFAHMLMDMLQAVLSGKPMARQPPPAPEPGAGADRGLPAPSAEQLLLLLSPACQLGENLAAGHGGKLERRVAPW